MDEILKIFIKNPEREFHIREIAKIINKSPTTISKYISKLSKEGLILSKKMSNHLLVKANTENIEFKNKKRENNIESIFSSGLIEHLENKFNNPESIILFGSFAKGEDNINSDIDIFLISPIKKEIDLENFEKKLKRKIQIFIHSKKEIEKMKKTNKELLNNLINGKVLSGFWEVFR
jgi:predicted nucleotidyltransferase